jgi:sulfur carrier protein
MKILINNEHTEVPNGTTVNEVVLTTLQLNSAGMAIAVNDAVVPKHLWELTLLKENDRMLVIKACSGG